MYLEAYDCFNELVCLLGAVVELQSFMCGPRIIDANPFGVTREHHLDSVVGDGRVSTAAVDPCVCERVNRVRYM